MAIMHFGSAGLWLAGMLATASVHAAVYSADMKMDVVASITDLSSGHKDVALGYETREEVSGVCDLILYAFNYDVSNASLSFTVKSEEPCLNEAYGKRTGATVWRVPQTLIQNSGRLSILINGQKAGTFSIENGQAYVTPENSNPK